MVISRGEYTVCVVFDWVGSPRAFRCIPYTFYVPRGIFYEIWASKDGFAALSLFVHLNVHWQHMFGLLVFYKHPGCDLDTKCLQVASVHPAGCVRKRSNTAILIESVVCVNLHQSLPQSAPNVTFGCHSGRHQRESTKELYQIQ